MPRAAFIAGGLAILLAATLAGRVAAFRSRAVAPVRSVQSSQVGTRGFPRTLAVYGCKDASDLGRRDVVVSYAYCDVKSLKRRNPGGLFLLVPGLFPTGRDQKGASEYGGMSVTYGSGLWRWRSGDAWSDGGCDRLPGGVNLGCLRQFDVAFDPLRNANGSAALISNGTSGHPGWNLPDPRGKGTRDLVARFMAYVAKLDGLYADGWDGVYSDNWIYGVIGASYAYGPNIDTDRDGKPDDPSTLRKQWDNGLNEMGALLRSYLPGKIVVGNGNWFGSDKYYGDDPQGWLKSANGTMVEGIERFYNSPQDLLKLASEWLGFRFPQPRYLLFFQNALTASGQKLEIPAGADPNDPVYMLNPGVMRSMRWGLTLALMSGAYYEIVVKGDHGTRWWYDEFDGGKGVRRPNYLGRPLRAVAAIAPGVWRRDFEHGIALNNSTTKPVSINLKKAFRHLSGAQNPRLNNGKLVTKVTIPGHDGVILLAVKKRK